MSHAIVVARAFALVVTASVALTAGAAGQRSFVASNGNDASTCTLAQPCRSFATAIANTNDKGEVIVLDSAGYGPVTITKSITIAAPAGVYAGISVFSGDGVSVAAAGVVVTLRGLTINRLAGTGDGISFVQGASLLVEDCEIAGNFDTAIEASASNAAITVRNTTLRNMSRGFHAVNSVEAMLDAVRVYDVGSMGVLADTGSKVNVANSTISGSFSNCARAVSTGALTDLTIIRSVLARCPFAVSVSALPGGTARIVSDGNSLTEINVDAFGFANSGGTEIIYTAGNNTVGFVTTPVGGGTLTPCCAI